MNVLVTGAAGYLGKSIADYFEAAGDSVLRLNRYLDGDCNADDYVKRALRLMDQVDLLVFAHGKSPERGLDELDVNYIREMLDANVVSPTNIIRLLRNRLHDKSTIIVLGSVAARKGSHDPSYSASKAALSGLMRSVEREIGCRAINLRLGLVENSPIHESMPEEHVQKHRDRMKNGQLINVEDVCKTIELIIRVPRLGSVDFDLDGGFQC